MNNIRKNEITTQDVKKLLLRAYKKYSTGEISEQQAYKEAFILNSLLKAIELTDLETRFQRIEGMLKNE